MARFIIEGGVPLSGTHTSPGNKNAALPMLAACMLTSEPVVLQNLPLINDVLTMLDILEELGVDVNLSGHTVTLCAKGVRKRKLSQELCRKVRSSILFAGPMVARFGKVTIFPPGGDVIGRRRLDTHFEGLIKLGVTVEADRAYEFSAEKLVGTRLLLDEASVTATENIIMAAVLAEGTTTIFNAACEPHVQDLCLLLNKMGAKISNVGTNYLRIEGGESLRGARHRIESDCIDSVSYLVAAAATGGSIDIKNVAEEQFDVLTRPFGKLGMNWDITDGICHFKSSGELFVCNDFGSAIPKIEDGPWPNFPSDMMSIAIVLATQANGTVLFFEKMFESRMYFVDRLIEMGGRIVQCDPHRVIVSGPSKLQASRMSSPDIRAGIALLIAALCAKGTSTIDNAEAIDRGYEKVVKQFQQLGAKITREE
jgi:UDP-N-acetylglucosamine 1-carboxyvinyltransferase